MPSGDNDDQKRVSALLTIQARSLNTLIAKAHKLRQEIEAHLQALRRLDRHAKNVPHEQRQNRQDRRRTTRRDRRKA